jgi:flagellar basal body-associated protein FliL
MINPNTIIVVGLTAIIVIFMFVLILMAYFLYVQMYRKKNYIDFVILELGKDRTVNVSIEKGRKKKTKNGMRYVTAHPWFASATRRDLGYNIKDEHIHPSRNSNKRNVSFVAIKDGIPAPIDIGELPSSLSLTPVTHESLDFALDATMDNAMLNDKPDTAVQKMMAYGGFFILVLCIIGVVTLIALVVTMLPDFAAQYTDVAKEAGKAAAKSGIPPN